MCSVLFVSSVPYLMCWFFGNSFGQLSEIETKHPAKRPSCKIKK